MLYLLQHGLILKHARSRSHFPCIRLSASTLEVMFIFGPRQANLVLIACASSEVQASLRIRAVSPEPSLLAHTSSQSRGTFRQKTKSLALLNCWACAVKVCHDGMLEDTNSLDGAHLVNRFFRSSTLILKNCPCPRPLSLSWQTQHLPPWGYFITLSFIKLSYDLAVFQWLTVYHKIVWPHAT